MTNSFFFRSRPTAARASLVWLSWMTDSQRSQFGRFLQAAVHRWCAAAAERCPQQVLQPDGGLGGRLRAAPPGARVASPLRYSLVRDRGGSVMCRGWLLCLGCVLVWLLRLCLSLVTECSVFCFAVPCRLVPSWVVEPPALGFAHSASLCCCSNSPSWPARSICRVSVVTHSNDTADPLARRAGLK